MFSGRQQVCRQEVGNHRSHRNGWCGESIRSTAEMQQVIRAVSTAMTAAGYLERDLFGMHMALEEAITNAIKHGHQSDWTKRIRVRYRVGTNCVLAEVADQGAGFDPQCVPDPLAPENVERPCGRGLLLMRHYMTWVRFNDRGNRVTLCKCRSV